MTDQPTAQDEHHEQGSQGGQEEGPAGGEATSGVSPDEEASGAEAAAGETGGEESDGADAAEGRGDQDGEGGDGAGEGEADEPPATPEARLEALQQDIDEVRRRVGEEASGDGERSFVDGGEASEDQPVDDTVAPPG